MLARILGAHLLLFGAAVALTVFGVGAPPGWKGLALAVWGVSVAGTAAGVPVVRRVPARGFWALVVVDSACVAAVVARAGLLDPAWTWLLVPVVLVASSPDRRWGPLYCLCLAVAFAAAGGGAYLWGTWDAGWDPLRIVIVGTVLVGIADLVRRGADAYWIEVTRAHSLHSALERSAAASTSFAASTARYLAGPLADIRHAADRLAAARDPETRRDACRAVVLAADAVDAILDEVLDAERLEAGLFALERAPVDIRDVLAGAAAAAGLRVRVEGGAVLTAADAGLLGDAFTALFEATGAGPAELVVRVVPERGGVRVSAGSAATAGGEDPRGLARLGLAEAIVDAHGGTMRREPTLEVRLPAGGEGAAPEGAAPGGGAAEIVRARDAAADWFVVLVLSLTAVGLALRRSWPGDVGLFLVAETLLVVVGRFASEAVSNRRVRVAATTAVAAVFGLLVGASGGLWSPVWVIAGFPAAGADVLGRRVMLGAGAVGSVAVGVAVVATWPDAIPFVYGLAPVGLPVVTAFFLIAVGDGIDAQRSVLDGLNAELAASRAATSMSLAVVSHELRTPLTSVRGYAESLLLPRVWDDDTRSEFCEAVSDEAGRLEGLAADLRDSAMIQSGTLTVGVEAVDAEALVRGVVARYRNQGARVRVHVAGATPGVSADPRRVEQVLANLLDNAMKHAPGAGPVDVVVARDVTGVRISVVDHGPGMPPGIEGVAFEPFRRAAEEGVAGAGLGLFVCKGIVDAHGSSAGIRCEATPGGGATVVVTLPAAG